MGVSLLATPGTCGSSACGSTQGHGLALLRSSTSPCEKSGGNSCAASGRSNCSSQHRARILAFPRAPASHHDGGWSAPWSPLDRNCCCSCLSQLGVGVTHPVWSAGACHRSHLSSASEDDLLAACPRAPDCSWNENPHWKARATSGFPFCPLLQSPRAWGCGQLFVAVTSCCSHGWRRCGRQEEVARCRSPARTASWAAQPAAGGRAAAAGTCSGFGFQTPDSPKHHYYEKAGLVAARVEDCSAEIHLRIKAQENTASQEETLKRRPFCTHDRG